MKRYMTIGLSFVLVLGLASMALADSSKTDASADKPGILAVEVVKLAGTVTHVDMSTKEVTIKGDGGRIVVMDAQNARNLDQVKVGDRVNAEFVESLALFVHKSDSKPDAKAAEVVELAPKGSKPAGLMAEVIEITANVVDIDHKKRTISLKGPKGLVRSFKAGPEIKRFDDIQKGDQVVLRHTEAVAITVTKP